MVLACFYSMFGGRGAPLSALAGRLLQTAAAAATRVDKTQLSRLRKKTGFPFIKCKNALQQFDNDLPQAESWLRDQAQKEGWTKATKLQGRAMSQGLVAIILDKNAAVMVEVNCETDFVARNTKFQDLVSLTAKTFLLQSEQQSASKLLLGGAAMSALRVSEERTLADMVALQVGQLGENMAVRRGVYLSAPAQGASLGAYIHAAGVSTVRREQCIMGKFGSLVLLAGERADDDDAAMTRADLGRQLAQHVVGMNPKTVGSLEEAVREEGEEEEGREEAKAEEEGGEEGREEEGETRMVFQEFLLEPQLRVADLLTQNSVGVVDYVRYECGEGTDDDDDAAAATTAQAGDT